MAIKQTKTRLDDALVKRQLAADLKTARALIMSGAVIVGEQRRDRSDFVVTDSDHIRLRDTRKYVSRGGEKLYEALAQFQLLKQLENTTILDVGASTGGFTDCCLQLGAGLVFAVEIGHNQIDWKLRSHERVRSMEGTDIRSLSASDFPPLDWLVGDISFMAIAPITRLLLNFSPKLGMILLVKPQFELPAERVPKGGVVDNITDHQLAIEMVATAFGDAGISPEAIRTVPCAITGRSGNQEYFVYVSTQNR
jgi:23S rRNA (cytidine1920-2'-O)/16S rRNA (cytidine1409-2'-O)-methyltransferase